MRLRDQLVAALFALGFFAGCSTVQPLDGVKRQPKETVEVFFEAQPPTRAYKIIATFSDRSNPGKEEQENRDFVNKAKRIGADGLILQLTKPGGYDVGLAGASTKSVYGAVAFVWR